MFEDRRMLKAYGCRAKPAQPRPLHYLAREAKVWVSRWFSLHLAPGIAG